MPTPVKVAVPSIGMSPLLGDLLTNVRHDPSVTEIRLYDNSRHGVFKRGEGPVADVDLVAMPGRTIYEEWNDAIEWAADDGSYLALLNDDIALPPCALAHMRLRLDADHGLWVLCPDWLMGAAVAREPTRVVDVKGVYRHLGVCGFALMVRAVVCPKVEDGFEVWFGDESIVWQVAAAGGRCGRLEGVGVAHATSTTVNALASTWTNEAIERDKARWAALGRPPI